MTDVYGHKWASQYGDEPNDTWSRLLHGLDGQDISRGLNALVQRAEPWPPNAAEFAKLCKKPTISPDGTNSAAYIEHKREPCRLSFDSRKELGKRKLAEIRAELGL